MKKYIVFCLFSVVLLLSCNIGQQDDAVKYNDDIIREQIKVIGALDVLVGSFETYENEKMNDYLTNFKMEIEKAQFSARKLEAFDKETYLRDAFLMYLDTLDDAANKEYTMLVENVKIPDSIYSQEDQDDYLRIAEKVDTRIAQAEEVFINAQKKFAANYRFVLYDKEL